MLFLNCPPLEPALFSSKCRVKPHVMHVALAVDEQLIKRSWKEVLCKCTSRKTDLRPPKTSSGLELERISHLSQSRTE